MIYIKKLVAIGGGENGRLLENNTYAPYETEPMDREIVNLTGKTNPNFLFVNHAMQSLEIQESYYQTMKKIYEKLGCVCDDLKSNELELSKNKIEWADIIYVGGGDTELMLNLWKKTGFDSLLYEAWNNGKVICGISAGAVCWFNSCNSDSRGSFTSLECLNWINVYVTPHGDEIGRYESTKEQLKDNIGILLSNCSAIEIIDNEYRIITNKCHNIKEPYVLKCYFKDNEFITEKLEISKNFKQLDKIMIK